jgi:hypothetical protein
MLASASSRRERAIGIGFTLQRFGSQGQPSQNRHFTHHRNPGRGCPVISSSAWLAGLKLCRENAKKDGSLRQPPPWYHPPPRQSRRVAPTLQSGFRKIGGFLRSVDMFSVMLGSGSRENGCRAVTSLSRTPACGPESREIFSALRILTLVDMRGTFRSSSY